MPRGVYNRIREMAVFRPENPQDLIQVLPQKDQRVPHVPHIQGFRFPAPGSVHTASVPARDNSDRIYDTRLYPRNPYNLEKDEETMINATKPVLHNPKGDYGDRTYGSTGMFGKPAVLEYDPSGLRSSMNATWKEMDIALAKEAKGDHLPHAEWENDIDSIHADCERKNIPYVSGRYYAANYERSRNYTDVRW